MGRSRNPGFMETSLIEYSGLEFYKRINACMDYTWLKAWELVRPSQRGSRLYIEKEYLKLLSEFTYKRLQWFEESFVHIEVSPDAAITIGLILDSSGSMKDSDPDGIRIQASQRIIDELSGNENVFIVDFDSRARLVNDGFTSAIHKERIKNSIAGIDANGGTSIGKGLSAMKEPLSRQSINPRSTAILLLTDGQGDYNNEINWYKYNGIPVYTVSYKDYADARLMHMLASETGGKYLQADRPEEIVRAFRQFYDDLSGFARIYSVIYETGTKVVTDRFYIESGTDEVIFEVNGKGFKENFTLITPGNQEVSVSESGAGVEKGEDYIKVKLKNPQEGYWRAVTAPGSDQQTARYIFEVRARSNRKVKLDINMKEKGVYILDFLDDNLVDYSNASVNIIVTAQDGSMINISQRIPDGQVPFIPAMGQGNYQLDIRLEATDRSGRKFQRQYFRSVLIDEYIPGYIGTVKRRIGKYVYSDQGHATRSKAGIQAIIYRVGNGEEKPVAEGVVTAVTATESTIEIKRRYGAPTQGDLVKLNIKQWKGD
jgi:Mg-chelatase subunit ChlD